MIDSLCYTDTKVEDSNERRDLLAAYITRMESLGLTDRKQYRRAVREYERLIKGKNKSKKEKKS